MRYQSLTPEQRDAERDRKRESAQRHKERVSSYHRQWYEANKEKKDSQNKEWAANNPTHMTENARRHQLKRYGMTGEDFDVLRDAQNCVCAICQKECRTRKKLSIDHDHGLAGRRSVRGLLCRNCNAMLGQVSDSIEILKAAILYLETAHARTQAILND